MGCGSVSVRSTFTRHNAGQVFTYFPVQGLIPLSTSPRGRQTAGVVVVVVVLVRRQRRQLCLHICMSVRLRERTRSCMCKHVCMHPCTQTCTRKWWSQDAPELRHHGVWKCERTFSFHSPQRGSSFHVRRRRRRCTRARQARGSGPW